MSSSHDFEWTPRLPRPSVRGTEPSSSSAEEFRSPRSRSTLSSSISPSPQPSNIPLSPFQTTPKLQSVEQFRSPREVYCSRSTPVLSPSASTLSSSTSALSPSPQPSKIPPPPFQTPPKLQSVEQVMQNSTGTDVASLRALAIALAKDAIYGKDEMAQSSLSGRKGTRTLSQDKLDYIKTLVRSRVPNKTQVEFEHYWTLCRASLSKSCQTLRVKRKL